MSRKVAMAFEVGARVAEALPRTLVNPMRRLTPQFEHPVEVTAGVASALPYSLLFTVSADAKKGTVEVSGSVAVLAGFFDNHVGNVYGLTLPYSMLASDLGQFRGLVRVVARQVLDGAEFSIPAFGAVADSLDERKMLEYVLGKARISEDEARVTHPAIFGEWW